MRIRRRRRQRCALRRRCRTSSWKRSSSAARRTTPRASSAPRSSASAGSASSRPRAFRRRFRDFHLQRRGAPILGFLHNEDYPNGALSTRFVRTSASCPRIDTQRGWIALDARGGRVLLHRTDELPIGVLYDRDDAASPGIRLAVWDPLSAAGGGQLELPVPSCRGAWASGTPRCSAASGTASRRTPAGPSASYWWARTTTFACVYSSLGPAAWSEPTYTAQHLDLGDAGCIYIDAVRGALVRNAFYFLFQGITRILKYDLATGDMSVIRLPPASHSARTMLCTLLMTTEDGGLGFARVEGDKLCLWSMEARPNGGTLAMEWIQGRVIDLGSLLWLPINFIIELLGFAEGLGMILVGTTNGFFSVDQKSGRIDKLVDGTNFDSGIVPYVSFYTPALRTTSTDEGPSANGIS